MNTSKNNKKTIYIVVACLIVILAIIGGVHHHKTHILDGQWIVKSADGEAVNTPSNYKPITLTISGNKHFKVVNDDDTTSGDIIRDAKSNTMQFLIKKQTSNNPINQTDNAKYGLSDDRKEMTLDFQDGTQDNMPDADALTGTPVVLVKEGSAEAKNIEKNYEKEKSAAEKQQRINNKLLKNVKGKTVNASNQKIAKPGKIGIENHLVASDGVTTTNVPTKLSIDKNGKTAKIDYIRYKAKVVNDGAKLTVGHVTKTYHDLKVEDRDSIGVNAPDKGKYFLTANGGEILFMYDTNHNTLTPLNRSGDEVVTPQDGPIYCTFKLQ